MRPHFETNYLVCVDHGDDINYVLYRTTDIDDARTAAKNLRTQWPGQEIYLTVEKVAISGKAKKIAEKNPVECKCGYGPGRCVGFLSCTCGNLDVCKRVDRGNPMGPMNLDLEYAYNPEVVMGNSAEESDNDNNDNNDDDNDDDTEVEEDPSEEESSEDSED